MTGQAAEPKRVLVTGSTGAIGQPVCERLLERGHYVRGFARRPTPGLTDLIQGDLNDRDKVFAAVEGMDAVIHLGAYPNPADFIDVLLQPNVVGLYYICEAAREFNIKRLVLASTVQTITGHRFTRDDMIRIEDGPCPVNHYALTKVWMEEMGAMYARVHKLSVLSVRIGWLPRNPEEAAVLKASAFGANVYFSHEDAKLFFERSVESPTPEPGESAIVFAISRPKVKDMLDPEPARRWIGYEPRDVWPEGLPFEID